MANIAGSFAQGMQIGGGLIDIANRKEDRKNAAEDREHRLARNQVLEGRQDTQWNQSQQDRTQSLADRDTARQAAKTQQARNEINWQHKQDEYNHQQKLQAKTEGLHDIVYAAAHKAIAFGDFSGLNSPEYKAFTKKYPEFDLSSIVSDEKGKAIDDATQILRAASNGQIPRADDPHLLNTVNALYPEITHGDNLPSVYTNEQGRSFRIKGRRLSGIHSMPNGSLAIQQELTLDDDSKVKVPVTENRSSNPNDPVRQVTMSDFSNRLSSLINTRKHLKQTQINNWVQLQTGRSLNFDSNGNRVTGGSHSSNRSSRAGGSSSSNSSLVKQQLAEANDINTSYDKQIADIKMQGLEPEEEKAQIDQLEKRRVSSMKSHDDLYSGLTDIRNSDLPEARRRGAADKVLNTVVKQYAAYDFDANDKYQIKQYVLDNPSVSPDDIQRAINAMIESGDVTKKNSNTRMNSNDLVSQIMNNGTSQASGEQSNNISGEEPQTPPAESEGKPQYGGEVGTALPGYERGEGLSSYGNRVAQGVRQGANEFAESANGLQSRLQNYISQ